VTDMTLCQLMSVSVLCIWTEC